MRNTGELTGSARHVQVVRSRAGKQTPSPDAGLLEPSPCWDGFSLEMESSQGAEGEVVINYNKIEWKIRITA